ncbi:hypothetical protein [Aquimarina sp. AU474]|uniref:hypothetical protein n=1 Tax=Aquimarina sp. AU474 TaxID=2108529 RepID=UPI001356A9B9|nr:hypothetical protein [Aquimarina sp. AU474]
MDTSNKIGLKKLTIAKINTQWMNAVKGGSSLPSNITDDLPTVKRHGEPCQQWH